MKGGLRLEVVSIYGFDDERMSARRLKASSNDENVGSWGCLAFRTDLM